jgi:integrase
LHDRVSDENGPIQANRVVELLGSIFSWHATRTDDFRSPIVRGMTTAEPSRDRVLADDELRAVWQATSPIPYHGSVYLRNAGLHPAYRALIRFLLLTGARRAEAAQVTWGEINEGVWLLPASRNKVGHDLLRPLSGAALAVLDSMPKTGAFVFSRRGGRQAITGLDELKTELDRVSGVSGWVHHDLRRTSRSLLSRAGVPSDIAEMCLGHVLGGVRGVYDRHKYIEEKRIAFEKLATVIRGIVNPPAANVVAMHRG